jgi:hypothetical protein
MRNFALPGPFTMMLFLTIAQKKTELADPWTKPSEIKSHNKSFFLLNCISRVFATVMKN